jgi:NitT/TauT family transport system permease protein
MADHRISARTSGEVDGAAAAGAGVGTPFADSEVPENDVGAQGGSAGPRAVRGSHRSALKASLPFGFLAILILAWEVVGRQPGQYLFPPPSKVVPFLGQSLLDGTLLGPLVGTIALLVVGFAIAVPIGLAVGVLLALSEWAENTVGPLVVAAYATPMVLIIPVVGIYLGFGLAAKTLLVVAFVIFPVIVNTEAGVRNVPSSLQEVARSFGASRRQVLRLVTAWAAMPQILVGLRLGLTRGFKGAILADVLLLVANVGSYLLKAQSTFNTTALIAGVFAITTLGYLIVLIGITAERTVIRRTGL